jgi:hypothetical protein
MGNILVAVGPLLVPYRLTRRPNSEGDNTNARNCNDNVAEGYHTP